MNTMGLFGGSNTNKLKLPEPKSHHFFLEKGLDLVTPPYQTKPGWMREGSENLYVDINGGFTTTKGYEAFDGQSSPSEQNYTILDVTITGSFAADDAITGADSSATATILEVDTATRTPQSYLVLGKVTGVFNASEDLKVSAVVQGNTDALQAEGSGSTGKLHAQYKNLVADLYRADIAAPTGSGSLLGGEMLDDVKYVFRNNAGDTAADLWKSTSSGWSQVALGIELGFISGGTTEIVEGTVLDGLVGGAPGQATLTRVMLESGSWAAGTATGKFIFASQTGTFEAGGVTVAAAGDLATIAGDSSAITLVAGGRYKIELYNFGDGMRMYGVDGKSRGFEFDGTVFGPIKTGMASDIPTDVVIFKKHLFFSFAASDQHSGIGTPYA
ncbi:hypothetical protein LCGC14_2326980, partial [marine sediment metagenome]